MTSTTRAPSHVAPLLFLNVFIIATCGLVYELLAGTLASYVLGDSVTQFSLVIGMYLSAMGVGAWLSRFLDRELARRFLDVELAVALVGGLSAPALFFAFGRLETFSPVLYGVVIAIGVLVGLELPLLMRLLADQLAFKELVSRVLTFDYIGALVASLLFPLLFVPRLGLVRTSLLMGMLNAGVALGGSYLWRRGWAGAARSRCACAPSWRWSCSRPASSRPTGCRAWPRRTSTPTTSSTARRRRTSASW